MVDFTFPIPVPLSGSSSMPAYSAQNNKGRGEIGIVSAFLALVDAEN
jgi:hypothetical protein